MSSTPLWLPLVVVGIGVVGTLTAGIAGAVIAHRWANQREDKAWARERERERRRWAREDEGRTFDYRREVIEDFYQAVKALARRAYDHGYGFDDTPELSFGWNADAFATLTRLDLYADRRVASTTTPWAVSLPLSDPYDQDTRTVRRTTTQPVRSIKAAQSRKATHVSWATWKACPGTDP